MIEPDTPLPEPQRCVVVVNESLSPGKASNAAAVVAFTLGQRHGALVGAPITDAGGGAHPGLIPIGIPILRASTAQLAALRQRAAGACDLVDFPREGQQTMDYEAFRQAVAKCSPESLEYLAIGLVGARRVVSKLVGGLALFA